MKIIKLISVLILIFIFSIKACLAATTNATPSSDIDKIKEKIASQVAEIKPATSIIRGKVSKVNAQNKSFVVSYKDKQIEVSFLSKTVYFWIKNDATKLSLNFGNVEVGDDLVIIGNKTIGEDKITAEKIYGKLFEKNIVAKISKIDKKTKTLTVKTISSDTQYAVDLNNISANLKFIKNRAETATTLDDLKVNDLISAKGLVKDPKKNVLTAKSFFLIQN